MLLRTNVVQACRPELLEVEQQTRTPEPWVGLCMTAVQTWCQECHIPPAQRAAQGDHEGAARQFVKEVAFGPGAWESELPPEMRAIFVDNAPTFLDELEDPNQLRVDEDALSQLELPVRLTQGSESPPTFPP